MVRLAKRGNGEEPHPASPLEDPRPRYGNTYIARVLNGRRRGLALAVNVSGQSRWFMRRRNLPFAGFTAGYLDLWETRPGQPEDDTAADGVTLTGTADLVRFLGGAEVQWLEGEALAEAVDLFGRV